MTNIKALIAGGILAVTASASMAQSLDPVRVEMFRSILKGNECVLTEAAASNILPRFDFSREETRSIVGALVAAGEVRLDGNTLNLVDGSCEAEDPVVALLGQRDVQQFIAVMAEYGCAMNEADAEQIFTDRGVNKAQVGAVVGPMIAANMATFEAGVLSVNSAYCAVPVVAEATSAVVGASAELDRSGMFGMGRVRALVDVMAANSCTLNMETPDAFLIEAEIEHSFATFVARKMISDGYASMVDAENMLLPTPYCVSANSPALAAQPSTETPSGDMAIVATAEAATASAETPATEMDRSGMFGMSRVQGLVDVMAQNGCMLNMEVADGYLAEAGLAHSFATFIAKKMISDGFAGMVDAQNMVLSAPYCISAGGAAPIVQAEAVVEQAVETVSDELGVDMAAVATIRQILSENGCRIDNEKMQELLPPAGFTPENAQPIFDFLEHNGEMSNVDGILIYAGASCTATPMETPVELPVITTAFENDGSPRGRFLAAVIGNGCALEISTAESLLADTAGLRMDQAFRIVDELVSEGEATLMSDSSIVQIDLALCAEPGTALAVVQTSPVEAVETPVITPVEAVEVAVETSDNPRAGLLAMLAANNCEVTQANAAALISAAGLDFNTSMQLLTQMMGSGEATSPDGGQTLNVGAPLCVAGGAVPMNPRETFINLIKQNNCSITAAEFGALLPVDGLDSSTAFGMISELEAEGVISLPATRDVVTLSAEMCR
ncbi:MAG: hypothetical protein COB08_013455 [Rhodobacteraceae bacterium]|nr:hypothetical protein [Paracoccaceae bacterium]